MEDLKNIDIDNWGKKPPKKSTGKSRDTSNEDQPQSRITNNILENKFKDLEIKFNKLEQLVSQLVSHQVPKQILSPIERNDLAEIFVSYISQYQTKSPSRVERAKAFILFFGIENEYNTLKTKQEGK